MKESIFNIIQFKVSGSVILDLFAGSGAFGAECISRGAEKVYFFDLEKKAIDTIKINTKNMGDNLFIEKSDYKQAILKLSKEGIKFDIIYLDPPYKSDYAVESLALIEKYNLLSKDGIIVIEHEFENDLQNIPKCYIIEKSKKYGIAYVDILKQTETKE